MLGSDWPWAITSFGTSTVETVRRSPFDLCRRKWWSRQERIEIIGLGIEPTDVRFWP
jgi:hypothetical protein